MNPMLLLVTLSVAGPPATALTAGETVTLRIRQVLPHDGLSAGERLLNSRPPLQVGDGFLAEIVVPPGESAPLVAGAIDAITPPGWFGRPGTLRLELVQFEPRAVTVADQRYLSPRKRQLLTALLALEGLGVGASVAAQFQPVQSGWVGTGAAIGLVAGLAYASCLPGREATLEPGDTFRVRVASVEVEQVPPELPFTLYPAQCDTARKGQR